MISIGNDIIALRTIDIPRTQSFRFYSKILSVSEQQLYQAQFTHLPFEYFVWLLWSIKESVYKCRQRHQPELVFSPVSIVLTQLIGPIRSPGHFAGELADTGFTDSECFCSQVTLNSQLFHARSIIYGDEVLATIAGEAPDWSRTNWGLRKIAGTGAASQSFAVREFLLEGLSPLYPGKELSIVKNNSGCPFLFIDGEIVDLPLSLSHHGEYVGYAFVK